MIGDRTIQYDGRGNPTAESRPGLQTVDLAYDGQGRLTSYARTGEADLTHVYNGLDDRVATTSTTTSGSETRRFVYAPDGRVLGEYGTSASDVKAEFIWMSPEAQYPVARDLHKALHSLIFRKLCIAWGTIS